MPEWVGSSVVGVNILLSSSAKHDNEVCADLSIWLIITVVFSFYKCMRYVIIKIDDRLDQNWKWIRRANGSTCWERRVRYTTSTIWHPLIVAMVRRRQSSALVDRVPEADRGTFSTM